MLTKVPLRMTRASVGMTRASVRMRRDVVRRPRASIQRRTAALRTPRAAVRTPTASLRMPTASLRVSRAPRRAPTASVALRRASRRVRRDARRMATDAGPGQDIADTLLRVGCQAMAAIGCLSFFKSFSSSGRQALTASKGVEASVAGLAPPGLVLACTSCMRGRRRNAGGSKHESSTPGSVSTIPRSTSWSHRRT